MDVSPAPSFSRTLRKVPALSEAEGVGDENHRRTLCRRTLQELVRNPTRETTVESHPSKNEGWAPGTKSSPMVRQGNNLMNAGQKFNLDPRLLVQIAGAETRLIR